ncbi:MAG: ABC transporter ATP-binding protein [Thermincolia bacterium]
MSTVIKVENLSKKYIIRHQKQERYTALRDVMTETAKKWGTRIIHPFAKGCEQDPTREEFLALQDVSFEIKQGERVGIIGRNGAGKSTLFKILSRITEPTTGRITIKGRVASLLEVGTGFHPELTGRENIYLNGAILGMSRIEIKKKFNEIVDFADVEKFLDTPVKRYSSGMYVRLAFAVAAHLEPEILIVDEVLAVGDMEFQKKCLGKMEDAGKDGRTVLFVSHNMEAISSLCNKGILLTKGVVSYQGEIKKTVSLYNGYTTNNQRSVEKCSKRGGTGGIRFKNIWISNLENIRTNNIIPTEGVFINLEATVEAEYQNKKNIVVGFGIDSVDGRRLLTCVSAWRNQDIQTKNDRLLIRCFLPYIPLIPERYLISASISSSGETLDYVEHCESLEIIHNDLHFSKDRNAGHGYLDVPYTFEVTDV